MIRTATLLLLVALVVPAAAQNSLPFAERFLAHAVLPASLKGTAPALKSSVIVVGEIVRVGDLIENAGAAASVAIFRAPDLGQTGNVAVDRVLEALRPHALVDIETRGLTEVTVSRASTAITPADLEARVVRALADRQRGADARNLTLSLDSEPRTIHLEPATDLRIARLTFDPRSGRFDVAFERPDRPRGGLIRVTGTYAETFEAAVLTRPLAVGEIVKAADIALVRRAKAEFGANIVTSATQAIGLAARRPMRPGDVIRQTDLAKPEIIARNDHVTITYEVPGITLTMRGKALEGGAQGEVIHVLNEQSKRSIQATVAGRGHVIITAPARVNVTATTSAPRLAADATGRPLSNPRASAE